MPKRGKPIVYYTIESEKPTNLNGTIDPEQKRLHNAKQGRTNPKSEVDADVLGDLWIASVTGVDFRPILQPNAGT